MAQNKASKSTTSTTVRFTYNYSTKNCHRYEECDAQGRVIDTKAAAFAVGSLYVQKSAVGEQPTAFLELTIATVGDAVAGKGKDARAAA